MTKKRHRGIFVGDEGALARVYSEELVAEIARRIDLVGPPMNAAQVVNHPEVLREVQMIFGTWGMPALDGELLRAAQDLRIVFFGAGSIRAIVNEAFWARNITIVSAYAANAIPVAEYALATILFSLKHGWRYALGMQREQRFLPKTEAVPGAFRTTVGIVSLSAVGRRVVELLRSFELNVLAYDPVCAAAEATRLGVELVSLDEIFARSHVVSLHAPLLPETTGLVTGAHFAAMRPGATFINTARGAIVREPELIEVLQRRSDLTAVLDVTWPEPPAADSPLLRLPNVVLTPHIAGSMDAECGRLGFLLFDELKRYLAGQPLQWAITREHLARMA